MSENIKTLPLQITEMVLKAREAQRVFETYSQQDIDNIVRAIGKYVYDNAELLSQMAIEDTGIGDLQDKIQKCRSKSSLIWNNLKGKKSRGIIGEDTSAGGSFLNGFSPTTTLGCGSWGGNSISENLNYTHLMNVSEIGKVIENKTVPASPAEIWD